MPRERAPLIVQGTFIVASAIIVEAILSFLGIGIPPEIPTWGNIMAEGRQVFQLFPHNILYPGDKHMGWFLDTWLELIQDADAQLGEAKERERNLRQVPASRC